VTYVVEWEPQAVSAASFYLKTRPDHLHRLLEFTDGLADDPRPGSSRAWGAEYRRGRSGFWRVLYRIDAVQQVVTIEHVGWSGEP
jgi:mRNA interferase RelE/StbE